MNDKNLLDKLFFKKTEQRNRTTALLCKVLLFTGGRVGLTVTVVWCIPLG